MIIRAISLWMPWSNWVAMEWKTIETRTHRRFAGLLGERIAIHSAQTYDKDAERLAGPYLSSERANLNLNARFIKIGGAVLCTAFVREFRRLTASDSLAALIDCGSVERFGLVLTDVHVLKECVPMRGRQGIWRAELPDGL